MKNSPAVSTMVVEEDVGLACPPFDDEDFMAAEASFFDLSEKVFFSGVKGDQKGAERFQGSSGNLNAVQILQKKHGRGKNMKVLEQVYKQRTSLLKKQKLKQLSPTRRHQQKLQLLMTKSHSKTGLIWQKGNFKKVMGILEKRKRGDRFKS